MALTTNLVSYWKFDESSGNAADSVGSNTLTNNNTITYVAGKIRNGADLELASSQYFSKSDDASLDITGSLSYACWVNLESQVSNSNMAFGGKTAGGSNRSWWVDYEDVAGTKLLRMNISSNGSGVTVKSVAQTLNTATWYHLAFVYDSAAQTVKIYVNAAQIGTTQTSAPASIFNSTAAFEVGAIHAGTLYFLDGIIDEAGLWSRVLTDDEIKELYANGGGRQYPFAQNGFFACK